ncbi:hypothetical protein BB561_004582 [Smittium simulii]|uniref:Cation-transporting P-type ATPase N-terminal domain-containing protein n=1 Tax=Smittium simulii TaxID=133385 RepID=A0A2T9YFH6_9FUNG|nr:hypothetical protein BB561_004582 [Smittium simulii]
MATPLPVDTTTSKSAATHNADADTNYSNNQDLLQVIINDISSDLNVNTINPYPLKNENQEYLKFLSAFPEGKESVEHQLDIYVVDMFAFLSAKNKQKSAKLVKKIDYFKKKYSKKRLITKKDLQPKNSQLELKKNSPRVSNSSLESSETTDSSSSCGSEQSYEVSDTDISLLETMENIQYTLDFRIKKGKVNSLDISLMRRLCDALLLVMKHETGSFAKKKFASYAESAFYIFGSFIEEIAEFRQAVSEKDISELRISLLLDKRFNTESQKNAVAIMVRIVLFCLGEGYDWRDLIDPRKQATMQKYIEKRIEVFANDRKSLHIQERKVDLYPPPALYSDRNIAKLVAMFNVNVDSGITDNEEVNKRLEHYGANELPQQDKKSYFKIIFDQLSDFMVVLLLIAVIATAIAKEYNSSIVLAVVIILNTFIGVYEESKASKALDSLKSFVVNTAKVYRNGSISLIDSKNLVPGDIVEIEEGDSVPADLRLIECSRLSLVETILTGESIPVMKSVESIRTNTNRLALGDSFGNCFMGTLVSRGRGRGIVVRTGSSTEIGKISKAISNNQTSKKTPLQKRLHKLGMWLVIIAILLCAIVVIAGVAWGHKFAPMFLSGLALAVSVIPEGLVAVTTVTMALAVRRAAKKQAIVKRLVAVEVLGSVTCICSDKTGTLTEGQMGATEIVTSTLQSYSTQNSTDLNPDSGGILIGSKLGFSADIKSNTSSSTFLQKNNMSFSLLELIKICLLCNNSQIKFVDDKWKGFGDPTEFALLSLALKAKMSYESIKSKFTNPDGTTTTYPKKLHENPFDSERKLMTVVIDNKNADKNVDIYAKGAPEQILKICTHRIDDNGSLQKLKNSDIKIILHECEKMAKRGLRVLGLAAKSESMSNFETMMKEVPENDSENPNLKADDSFKNKKKESEIQEQIATYRIKWAEGDLAFVGLVGLTDPPRKGVKEAIKNCQSAGIKVIMITGDHLDTASAIAKQIGILQPNIPEMDRAITGPDLDLLSDETLASLKPFPSVFARVSPDHKLRIIKTLQKMGHISAMTGDGVNDAPAVRQADIGIAMGIGGTEITKDASDIVLLDDNFSTIIMAIEEGRRVFDNILKFILYLLSCNTAEIILFLMASVVNVELPMPTIMVLWANIIADVPPAMSVGLEPQEKNILKRSPRSPSAGVLNKSIDNPLSSLAISVQPDIDAIKKVDEYTHDNIPDDLILSTPGLTAKETETAYYEKNKIYHWRGDL